MASAQLQVRKFKETTPSQHGLLVHEVLALRAEGLEVREEVRASQHGLARKLEGRAKKR